MILQFAFNNFRCVREDNELEFRKMNLKQHADSLIKGEILPVAVIYGPNGGGKSTVLRALDYLFRLVGNPIRQAKMGQSFPVPTLTPFLLDKDSRDKPSEFQLIFTLNKDDMLERKYYIRVFRGEIIEESLYEKGARGPSSLVFQREADHIAFGSKYNGEDYSKINDISKSVPLLSLLTILFDESEIAKVGKWFTMTSLLDFAQRRIEEVLAGAFIAFIQDKEYKAYIDQILQETQVVSGYQIIDNRLPTGETRKAIYTKHQVNGSEYPLPIGEESAGTHKLFEVLPAVVAALVQGTPAIIDELDAKLHPKLLEFLIGLFTNPKTNEKGAQLIFTSHDMYTLRSEVFRRDEIWFAAKNDEGSTVLYSLGDIKGDDNRTTRSDLSFSKRYLDGRYGADPYYQRIEGWEEPNGD
ncbi:MAG: ATP-binding protein [Bacilli bacterium]|nr:ATP-binding protein [Bacilli bacterium]